MSRHYPTRSLACLVLLSGLTAGSVQADVVTDWNSVALDAVIAAREAQPTQARSVTMVHVAMALSHARDTNQAFASGVIVGSLPGRGRSSRAASAPYASARSTQRWTV